MLKNYFKLAIKVLGRNLFFTGISLFGISFTLMILMLIVSLLQAQFGNNAPMSNKEKLVFLPTMTLKLMEKDTIFEIDTLLVDGKEVFDTTKNVTNNSNSTSTSSVGYGFLDRYMRKIESAIQYSFFSSGHTFDVFIKSNKLTLKTIYSDDKFWQVFDFRFTGGKPFDKGQLDRQEQVAVITEKLGQEYFGNGVNPLEKEVEIDGKHFLVIGVINDNYSFDRYLDADVYLPYTSINPVYLNSDIFLGTFEAVFQAKKPSGRQEVKDELLSTAATVILPKPEEFNTLEIKPMTFMERYATSLINNEDPQKSLRLVIYILSGLLFLFILLPTLNLINLNVSRILERSSEIGVRKAFGAHSSHILFQFIFENIIVTIVGGLVGWVLALILINVINNAKVFPNTILKFDFQVFFYSLLICLLFGIISGLIPAFKMSKVHIVQALKQNQV